MTVYVDHAHISYGRMQMSHMMADSELELHRMAQNIGLKREWFQGDHYDVSKQKRANAIRLGDVPVSSRFLVQLRQQQRSGSARARED